MKKRICFLILKLMVLLLLCTSVPGEGIKQEKIPGYNRNNGYFVFREDAIYYIDRETRRSESQQKTIASINMSILPVKEPLPGVQIINCRYTVIEQDGEKLSILSFHLSDKAGVFLDDYFELIESDKITKLFERPNIVRGNVSFLKSYIYVKLTGDADAWFRGLNINIDIHIDTSKGELNFRLPTEFFIMISNIINH